MALAQLHYRGRSDREALNCAAFDHSLDSSWVQEADRTFRVRFSVEGSGTVGGTLEANLNGGSFASVSTTSGTVAAVASERFCDEDATTNLLPSALDFTPGSGSVDGAAPAVTLADAETELEYVVRIVGDDITTGALVGLRVAGLDSYAQTPSLLATSFADRDKVRLKIGDTDESDPLLYDDEIAVHLAAWPENLDLAAANAAEAIAAKFARGFTFSSDGQQFNVRERVLHYMALAETLRKRGGALAWPTS